MSKTSTGDDGLVEDHRSREEKLEALIKKDLSDEITATAKRALERRRQEDSS